MPSGATIRTRTIPFSAIATFYAGAGERSTGYLTAQSDGIQYPQMISVPKSLLNEDDGVFDDTDEVYVQADFIDGAGGKRTQYTNPVSGIL